jgi:hypothetical protein
MIRLPAAILIFKFDSMKSLKFKVALINQRASRYGPLVRLNQVVFWWYYRRIPEFYRQWTILKSISVLSGAIAQLEREWQSEAKRADRYFSKVVEMERKVMT